MKSINKTLTALSDCNKYVQTSVLMSMLGLLNYYCISHAGRYVPDLPEEGSGIDGYTAFEEARRQMRADAQRTGEGDMRPQLPALVALREDLSTMFEAIPKDRNFGADMSLAATVKNINEREFDPKAAGLEYDRILAQGIKLYVSRMAYVASEGSRFLKNRDRNILKNEAAADLCERMANSMGERQDGVDNQGEPVSGSSFGDLDEDIQTRLIEKMMDKLIEQFTKMSIRRGQGLSRLENSPYPKPSLAEQIAEQTADMAFVAQAIWSTEYIPNEVYDFMHQLKMDENLPKGVYVFTDPNAPKQEPEQEPESEPKKPGKKSKTPA